MNHDHRITEADNQELAPSDRPIAEGQFGQPAQPAEASSATPAPEADSDEATRWPGCAKCGLTLTCECNFGMLPGGTFWKDQARRKYRAWAETWFSDLTGYEHQQVTGYGWRGFWISAREVDLGRHTNDFNRQVYRKLLAAKALYLLTH